MTKFVIVLIPSLLFAILMFATNLVIIGSLLQPTTGQTGLIMLLLLIVANMITLASWIWRPSRLIMCTVMPLMWPLEHFILNGQLMEGLLQKTTILAFMFWLVTEVRTRSF